MSMFSYNKKLTLFLGKNKENNSKPHTSELDIDANKTDSKDRNENETSSKRRDDLLMKLKSLAITDDDNIDSDTDDERGSDSFDSDVDNLCERSSK